MAKTQTLTLESFKELVNTDKEFKSFVSNREDTIDIDHGFMMIYRENLMKYLEQYMCKNEQDLEDYLWYNHGVMLKIKD